MKYTLNDIKKYIDKNGEKNAPYSCYLEAKFSTENELKIYCLDTKIDGMNCIARINNDLDIKVGNHIEHYNPEDLGILINTIEDFITYIMFNIRCAHGHKCDESLYKIQHIDYFLLANRLNNTKAITLYGGAY